MKYGAVAAVYLLVLTGCGQSPAKSPPGPTRTVSAWVETLATEQLPVYAVVPGTVVSADRVEISSRLGGYIYDLDVHEGQRVKRDQLLFAVDPTQVKEQIRQAGAEQAKAQAALAEAEDNYRRFKNLFQEGSATKAAYQQAERNYKVARGNLDAAEAALKAARSQLKYSEVRAPFDGLIVSKFVDNGQLSSPGTPVLVIESPDHMQLQVQVD
ncbi:MAG: efflux RND transporter periplasmic adaptor subunit, partial [Desulfosarcinaceae bacterium]